MTDQRDIAEIDAEYQAMLAADGGNWQPLAQVLLSGCPLSEAARDLIAAKITGKHKARRGPKVDPDTMLRNKQAYLDFLHLRQTGECPSNDTAYATIAAQNGREPDAVRKSVEAGRKLYSARARRDLLGDGSH